MLACWLAALASFVFAAFVAVTGGVRGSYLGVPFSARRVVPICIVAWLFVILGARTSDAARLEDGIARCRSVLRRFASPIAAGAALATFLAGVSFGAFTAAGADPYGYLSQARLWANGNPVQFQTQLALNAPWPRADQSFCPLGYGPSTIPGLIVPAYAPGVPLQMAALVRVFGLRGAFFLVPLAGAASVWMTFVLGRHVSSSPATALVSALLLALSPPFVFHLMQPTSDVPATAWWLLGIVAGSEGSWTGAAASGVAAAMAVLTRPNLLPLAIPLAAWVARTRAQPGFDSRRVVAFAIGMLPGIALTAAVNTVFYGSPLASGYGSLADIYRLSFAPANLARYPVWLWQTYSAFIFLPPIAVLAPPLRRNAIHAMSFTIVLGACYVFYRPFDHWTYLRFLLPGIPWLVVMAACVVREAGTRRSARTQAAMLAAVATIFGLSYVRESVQGGAFAAKALFYDRYEAAASTAAAVTPPHSAVICVLQSGSLRYYADRLTVRYDVIDPEWLDEAVRYLTRNGRTPYLALEATETDDYFRRFGPKGAAFTRSGSRVLDPKGLVTLFGPLSPDDDRRP